MDKKITVQIEVTTPRGKRKKTKEIWAGAVGNQLGHLGLARSRDWEEITVTFKYSEALDRWCRYAGIERSKRD
jgi:hypothetical protein